MQIDKKELLELLKNHLVISIKDDEFAPYYDQSGYVQISVSLNWLDGNELTEITSDRFTIYK